MDPMSQMFNNINVPEEFFTDAAQQSQLREFWSKLDSMAEDDPEEYKKFISSAMEQGGDEMKKQFGAGENPKPKNEKVQSTFSVCVETRIDAKKTKGFVNFCHHDNILPPLTQQYTLSESKDPADWAFIPFSNSSKTTVKKSGKTILYYDVHCAPIVTERIHNGDMKHRMGLVGFVLRQLGTQEKLEFIVDMRIMKFHNNYISTKKTVPEHKIVQHADYALFKQAQEFKEHAAKASEVHTRPKEPEAEVQLPTPAPPSKPIIMEEITGYKIVKSSVDINIHEGDTILLEIKLNQDCNMSNIELDIAAGQLRLAGPSNLDVLVEFVDYKVDQDDCKAKFSKKTRLLAITLGKLK